MVEIKSIGFRKILNSHVKFTNEFVIELDGGQRGAGASPQGETISIYEDKKTRTDAEAILQAIKEDGYLNRPLGQADFDVYLQERIPTFGRNNAFGLSLAFFNATRCTQSLHELFGKPQAPLTPPRISFNILNGGWHAYTNPVLSDFSEFMLVAKSADLVEVIEDHNEIQRVVHERLLHQSKAVVSGNPVNCFSTPDNRECIEFLLNICQGLGLLNKFDLMIDASAGDLWKDGAYRLAITDNSEWSGEKFTEYWLDIIRQYGLVFLEDPFHERDFAAWQNLTATQECRVIGDNLYSSDAGRIAEGAEKGYAHGVVIKPNQAGTVTSVRLAAETAHDRGHLAIASHRSISTESTFLSELACILGLEYIKIGPLVTDYSSVVRYNELIRLTGDVPCQ